MQDDLKSFTDVFQMLLFGECYENTVTFEIQF
jgi:hypothetical protein